MLAVFDLYCLLVHFLNLLAIIFNRPNNLIVGTPDATKAEQEDTIPMWRKCFIANELNEIQTIRRVRPTFLILLVVLFLEVVGFADLGYLDPNATVSSDINQNTIILSPRSDILRFPILVCVFIVIGM